jgi:hypothetical protein
MTDLEQKTLFAERLLRRPDDALMIVANILGKDVIESNPMLPISLAQDWPNDPFVVAEMQRLKAILPSLEDIAREIHEKAKKAFEQGEQREYFSGMRLYAEVTGLIKKGVDGGKSDDRLQELADMVLDPTNTERV